MRILLVDPDPTILDLVTRTLGREFRDLEVEQVRRRAEFEALLNGWRFDLVLTELNLGWAEGIYILRALRERMLQTPVILFSGTEYEERVIRQATYGFTDYLLKEQMRRLPFTVRRALERAELEQSLANALGALESLSPDTSEAALRERTEQALVQSEKRFVRFFHANPIPSIIATFPEGILQDINNAGQQTLGFTKAEMLNKRAVELDLWPNLEDRKLLVEELGKGNAPFTFETALRCKDGGVLDVIIAAELIEEGGKHYILSMFQDVTDRRRMERSLKFRAQFETLIARISTHFINLPIDSIDAEIQRAIAEIGQFWGVDFAALAIFTEDLKRADFPYYWNSEERGIAGFGVTTATYVETAGFPYLMSRLSGLAPVNIPSLEYLRAEAEREALNLSKLGIRSAILVPVAYGNVMLGALFLASLQKECFWGEESTSLLKTAAEIMASTLTRKRAEERLAESRRHYRLAVEAGRVAVWDWKMDEGQVLVDPFLKKILGYEEHEIDSNIDSWLQLLTPKDRKVAEALMRDLLQGSQDCLEAEARLFDRNGHARWFLVNGSIVNQNDGSRSMLGTLTDITDRKKAKLELDRFFKNAFDMLCVADTNGYFLRVNPAWERALGYTLEELTSRPYIEFVHPDDVAKTLQEADRLSRGMVTIFFENRYRAKDGSYRWLLWNATPAHDGLIYAVAHDITERKQAEAALKESEEQLRQAQKMEAIGQLAGGVAHDFNNIMTVIKGYCELALESMREDNLARSHVQEIERAADRAASLTRQLLAFSRKQVLQPIILSPNTVIEELKKMLRRLVREDIDLIITLDPELGRARVDRGQLEQVILNLVVNARDAMPDGGKLVIRTANVDVSERQDDGKYVMVAVSDNGVGMDELTRKRVFEPFFTTKEVGKGTGLGLSTVYGIVTQSGGFIELDTAPMEGTTFKVYLPRLEQPEDLEEEALRVDKISTGKTILLVEDDESVRLATRLCLETRGFKVLDASDGEKALEICRYFGDRIDLVITDLIMPRVSGTELVARIKQIYPEISVLYMSGYTGEVGGILDSVNLLHKPFSVDQLFYKLNQVLTTYQ